MDTLAAALEREHHEIDSGVEAFLDSRREDTDSLTRALSALRRHIYLEEEFVFPPLREAGMVPPIFVMLREHGEIWDTMDRIDRELVSDPAAASISDACHELLEQLESHNSKEEPIIYPQADNVLDDAATAQLEGFLETGEMPPGWVCANAGG